MGTHPIFESDFDCLTVMSNAACQLGGWITSLLSGFLTIFAVAAPYWSRDTHNGDIMEMQGYMYGLWCRCIYQATGHFVCDDYDRFIVGLPAEIAAARALAVISCVIWLLSVLTAVMGLNCINYRLDDKRFKGKLAVFGALGIIIHGLMICVAGSMWAYRLVTDFYSWSGGLSYQRGGGGFGYGGSSMGGIGSGVIMEPGASIWCGWFSCFLSILGGILIICGRSRDEDSYGDEGEHNAAYLPEHHGANYNRRPLPKGNPPYGYSNNHYSNNEYL